MVIQFLFVDEFLILRIFSFTCANITVSDSNLDSRRIDLLMQLVLLRRSLLIPFVVTMTESCPEALIHMSCHILGVSALADEILGTINIVTKKIRNLLNKDLSLTTNSTKDILKSEFTRYFTWLRQHEDGLRKICRNNEIFCSVDKSVKAWLKGEEYESPAQLLTRYNQKYRKYLTNINIPLQAFRMEDVRQAVKDVKRDSILLNNVQYSPHEGVSRRNPVQDVNRNRRDSSIDTVENIDIHSVTASERRECLAHAVVEQICSALSAKSQRSMRFSVTNNDDHSFSVRNYDPKAREKAIEECLNDSIPDPSEESSLEFERIPNRKYSGDVPSVSTTSLLSADNISGDSFEEISTCTMNVIVRGSDLGSSSDDLDSPTNGFSISGNESSGSKSINNSESTGSQSYKIAVRVHENLLEMLLNQVLLAASRTTAGGDAFFILENLYGGEGYLFSPRSYKTHMRKRNTHLHSEKEKGVFSNFLGVYEPTQSSIVPEDIVNTIDKNENYSGIEIEVTLTGIRVVLKEQYNLLLKESLEQNMELSLPLISFECTTTTQISFPTGTSSDRTYGLYNTLLYNTEKVCQRTVSIEPLILK